MSRGIACLLLGAAAIAMSSVSAYAYEWEIANKSSWTIQRLYISACKDDEWGEDQLGERVIRPGGSFTLTDVPGRCYDMKLVDQHDEKCEVRGIHVNGDWRTEVTNANLRACVSQ